MVRTARTDRNPGTGPTDTRIVRDDGRSLTHAQQRPARRRPIPLRIGFPAGAGAPATVQAEPGLTGRGHAAGSVRQRREGLRVERRPAVVIGPDPAVGRGVRACRQAGPEADRVRPLGHGTPVIVMEFRRS
ncbi:MAG: hypothetical protein N2Z62_01975 [Rhodobacteraceae bacterium]|nr:hypothetical protein [Paracoccaceae bacterium]